MDSVESIWHQIIAMLAEAERGITFVAWRERYGSSHPDHKTDEIDNPTRWAEVNWFTAKWLYCNNKDGIDNLYNKKNATDVLNHNDNTRFIAMKKLIEKEAEEQLEKQLLEGDMPRVSPEIKQDVELDEDEKYVAETEASEEDDNELDMEKEWDGDEFLGYDEEDEGCF